MKNGVKTRSLVSRICIVVIILIVVAGISALLNTFTYSKLFLALLIPILAALREIFNRLIKRYSILLVSDPNQYLGEDYEDRVKARSRDLKSLEDLSFYTLVIVTTGVALMQVFLGGE